LALAKAQRRTSAGFAATTTSLNNGGAFNLSLTVGGNAPVNHCHCGHQRHTCWRGQYHQQCQFGVTAQLVNTGNATAPLSNCDYRKNRNCQLPLHYVSDIATLPGLNFSTSLESAADASLKVNGVAMTRPPIVLAMLFRASL
jgi:hypothetical protein